MKRKAPGSPKPGAFLFLHSFMKESYVDGDSTPLPPKFDCALIAIALLFTCAGFQAVGMIVRAGGLFFMFEITKREPSKMASAKANLIGNLVSDLTSIQK